MKSTAKEVQDVLLSHKIYGGPFLVTALVHKVKLPNCVHKVGLEVSSHPVYRPDLVPSLFITRREECG